MSSAPRGARLALLAYALHGEKAMFTIVEGPPGPPGGGQVSQNPEILSVRESFQTWPEPGPGACMHVLVTSGNIGSMPALKECRSI